MPSEYDADTIAFYNEHEAEFSAATVSVDMTPLYRFFLDHIPTGGRILDAGSGSGRDSLAFLNAGYKVVSIDAASEMVRATTDLTGQQALLMRFDEMNFDREFDGIWACASLLHVSASALPSVLHRITKAMKVGTLYCSFKYGDSERFEKGRLFTDQSEASFDTLVRSQKDLELMRMWVTKDARPERTERWLNALLQRA